MSVGQATQFAPDYAKAKASIGRVFKLLDSHPSIDIYSEEGAKPVSLWKRNKYYSLFMIYH